jgi:superoxide reductase
MAQVQSEILSCDDCPILLEVIHGCDQDSCSLTCTGKPLKSLSAKTADQGKEKHVPVVEKVDGGYKVKVGDVPHPMEDDHWIQWIELQAGKKVYRQFLDPGEAPEAVFKLDESGPVTAREHCNKHGLWKG